MNSSNNLNKNQEQMETHEQSEGVWEQILSLLYWLAGARRATLVHLPESERERIAVLGSSVLIPTMLAFFGMYLYASSRFETPSPVTTFFIATVWAFVIMNVDRILMATYRPFQPWSRKVVQVCFRIGLAAVISVAIAFPFCLEQYQGAIQERLQAEYHKRLDDLQIKEMEEREEIETRYAAIMKDLQSKLALERAAGPIEPKLYAEKLAQKEILQLNVDQQSLQQKLDQQAATALNEWKRISGQIREVEQDLKNEAQGALSSDRGGTGKPGQGAKFKELSRDLEMLAKTEQTARQRYEELLKQAGLVKPADSSNAGLSALNEKKQAYFLVEAEERKARLDKLTQSINKVESDHTKHLNSHELRFGAVIKKYRAKAEGHFDPMEETIGLFKVIFVPEPGNSGTDQVVQQYKWMAALFQFSIVFGTLFLLDLIAILSKVMSCPGPYDVLVEFPEMVSSQNFIAFKKKYPQYADAWAENTKQNTTDDTQGVGVDLRDAEELTRLLFRTHSTRADGVGK